MASQNRRIDQLVEKIRQQQDKLEKQSLHLQALQNKVRSTNLLHLKPLYIPALWSHRMTSKNNKTALELTGMWLFFFFSPCRLHTREWNHTGGEMKKWHWGARQSPSQLNQVTFALFYHEKQTFLQGINDWWHWQDSSQNSLDPWSSENWS